MQSKISDDASVSDASTDGPTNIGAPAGRSLSNPASPNWVTPVWIIAIILILAVIYVAKSLLVPFTLAILGYLVLRPLVCKLAAAGLNHTVAAGLVVTSVLALVLLVVSAIFVPARQWLDKAPQSIARLRGEFEKIREPINVVEDTEDTITKIDGESTTPTVKVDVERAQPGLIDSDVIMSQTGTVAGYALVVVILILFLLTTGDELLTRVLGVLPTKRDRETLITILVDIQNSIGRYLGHITAINFGLGVAVAIVMYLAGLPTPLLWGALAMFCNFIPYVGPLGANGLVLIAATAHFDSMYRGLFTAALFWLTTAIEGQFVTPAVIGKSLRIGPVAVLVAVAFWGYMWGLAGIFLAVPLMIVMRLVCGEFATTRPLATILGDANPDGEKSGHAEVDEIQPLADAV